MTNCEVFFYNIFLPTQIGCRFLCIFATINKKKIENVA